MEINLEQEKQNLENVEVREVSGKGKGLFAKKNFKKGDLIWVLYGDTVNYATDYTIPINEFEKVEPRLAMSVGQFMNHSCDPNIHPDKTGRNYLATRDIEQGEELATNYAFLGYDFGGEKTIDGKEEISFDKVCHCGSRNCKKILVGYKGLTKEERKKWKDYVLPFLLNK
jgi:SET domain-containing protein